VNDELPRVTVIVPTKPGQAEIKSVEAARRLDHPRERLEVIVARGKQPAIQRNRALREATGEIIYFLDDDSQPAPGALRRAIEHFRDPAVQMVGGPNLCPPDAPFLEQVFAIVLSSWVTMVSSRARYWRVGKVRATSEKELILCNLMARRSTMLELGGFNEALYPNEENALMDEVQKRGGKLIYDPDIVAFRRPRPTLRSFCTMLMTYGRGRAEQFRLYPTPGSALNFVPPLFVLFLLLTPIWVWLGWYDVRMRSVVHVSHNGESIQSSSMWLGIAWSVVAAYAIALVGQTIANCRKGILRAGAALPFLFATHVFYGLGFWRGLFSRMDRTKPSTTDVTFDRITL
jgi:succinoglycan biosynthesis protein ExoA